MTYPQLDIRRLDPQLSPALSNMVRGTFYFDNMDHEMRVFRLSALIKLYRLVMDLGDLEHTGDWDWRISVCYTKDEQAQGVFAGTTNDTMCDNIWLSYNVEPHDYTDHFTRWTHLTVEVIDDESANVTIEGILIDDIRFITIEEA